MPDQILAENVFTTLYEQHAGKLYSIILRYVKSESIAEDLVAPSSSLNYGTTGYC